MHVWILFPTPIIYVEYYIVGMNHDDLDKEGGRTFSPAVRAGDTLLARGTERLL